MGNKFCVVVFDHRVFGHILLPYLIQKANGKDFYSVSDRVTSSSFDQYPIQLTDTEKEITKTIEQYDDNELVKLFSKKKVSASDFLKSIDKDRLQNHIRPYIEKRIVKCIDFIITENIPFYFKEQTQNIYESDFIEVKKESAYTVFNFSKEENETRYFLSMKHEEKEITLNNKPGIILSNEPCRLILENRLYLFDDIDGKKLLPFFTKPYVSIPKSFEDKYYDTFVRNALKKYNVNARGFRVNDAGSEPSPILSLEKDLNGIPVLLLKFRYDDQEFIAGNTTETYVSLEKENGDFIFSRLRRNFESESEYNQFLVSMGLKKLSGSFFQVKPLKSLDIDHQDLYNLIDWISNHEDKLKSKGFGIEQNFLDRTYNLNQIRLNIDVKNDRDWFDVHAIVRIGDHKIPFIKLKKHILNNIREFELPDGEVVILPSAWFAKYRDFFLFGKSSGDHIKISNMHIPVFSDELELPKHKFIKKPKAEDDPTQLLKVSENLNATLRHYQHLGYAWLRQLQENKLGACLADDMGLGKTLQTLAILQSDIDEDKNRIKVAASTNSNQQLSLFEQAETPVVEAKQASLIVMPSSLIHNWHQEITRFTSGLKVTIYGGSNRTKQLNDFGKYDIILSTYGIVRNESDFLRQYKFYYLILDESQIIKNPGSKTYQAISELQSKYRIVLTGTPIENSLSDLWSQLNFLNKGILGSLRFFKEEFIVPIEKNADPSKEEKLKKLISPYILRRTKQEVARELPPLSEQIVYCDMSDDQRNIYEEEKSRVRNAIIENIENNGIEKSAIMILQALTKMRQLANHPMLIDPEYSSDSGKFDEICRNLENIIGEKHKVLIFSSFVKHLNLFADFLNTQKYDYAMLTGETRNRKEAVDQFQNNPDTRVFLISLKAGGVGLNLTAADYVFLLEPWWNPAVENQAINRAHRIGQHQNVFVYRYISSGTIEEKIIRLQERKSRLADLFINSNNPFKELNLENIRELFS